MKRFILTIGVVVPEDIEDAFRESLVDLDVNHIVSLMERRGEEMGLIEWDDVDA